jgi:uncharacterized low-complexity protein
MNTKKTALSLAIGSAFAVSLAGTPVANAAENPFGMQALKSGYVLAEADTAKDGKAVEGKCGGKKAEEMKAKDGKCGNKAKMKDGKCGEGKCGGTKKGADDKSKEGKCGGKK